MKTIKGPAIFLAQFAGDDPPFNKLGLDRRVGRRISASSASRSRSWDGRLIDLAQAPPTAREYCDEIKGIVGEQRGRASPSCPPTCRASWWRFILPTTRRLTDSPRPSARQPHGASGLGRGADDACRQGLGEPRAHRPRHLLRCSGMAVLYPWPQRPAGLVDTVFRRAGEAMAARSSTPFDDVGVNLCYEIHPGEDLHDGVTFEIFLEKVGGHPR